MHHSLTKRLPLNLGAFVVVPPGWRFRVRGPRKMAFFGASQHDLVPGRGSNERPLSRIRALSPTPPLRTLPSYAPGWRFRVGGPRKMGVFGSSQHELLPPPLRTFTCSAPGWRFRVGGSEKCASSALRNMNLVFLCPRMAISPFLMLPPGALNCNPCPGFLPTGDSFSPDPPFAPS